MALDEAMLTEAINGPNPVTRVRFYRWSVPTLSVGAKRTLPSGAESRARSMGVEVVRRPTGGGAVLHHGDLTYSVVAPDPGTETLDLYRMIAAPLITGLSTLGLQARIASHNGPASALACFAQPTGADLEIKHRKICGSAQLRRNGWFLQHGSIPIPDVRKLTAQILGTDLTDTSTSISELLPGLTFEILAAAITSGFAQEWGLPVQLSSGVSFTARKRTQSIRS